VVLSEETASNLFVTAAKLLEDAYRIDSGQGHDQKKATKTDHESDTGAVEKRSF
jgi:hypothetical protein